jgi:hypothetical protein
MKTETKLKEFYCYWTKIGKNFSKSYGRKIIKALNKLDAKLIFISRYDSKGLLLDNIEEKVNG